MKKLYIILALLMILGTACTFITTPAVVNFSLNPNTITDGGSSTLIWNTVGATTVRIDPGIGTVPLAGVQTVSPSESTIYTLTATNAAGSVTQTATLTVNPPQQRPVIVFFNVNPSTINRGDSANLQWNVTGATSVIISPGIGIVAASGSQKISPTDTITYTLTATNDNGSIGSTTVITVTQIEPPERLPPTIVEFSISPSTIILGRSATLRWNVTGATDIFIDNGIGVVSSSGSQLVSPSYFTAYTLTASNSLGIVNKTVYVDVWYPSEPYPYPPFGNFPFVILFDINPPVITRGGLATMSWQVAGADMVYIDHGIGTVAPSGSTFVSPVVTTNYRLTATNSFGSITSSATVAVSPLTGMPVINSFTISPTSIERGQSAILRWNVTGATSVSINQSIGAVGLAGSRAISPTTSTIYTIIATNSAGSINRTASVTVHED